MVYTISLSARQTWATDLLWSKNTYWLDRIVKEPGNRLLYYLQDGPDRAFCGWWIDAYFWRYSDTSWWGESMERIANHFCTFPSFALFLSFCTFPLFPPKTVFCHLSRNFLIWLLSHSGIQEFCTLVCHWNMVLRWMEEKRELLETTLDVTI